MNLSVIIPVHNRIEQTKKCLAKLDSHLKDFSQIDISVVVIDAGSTDGTSDWITLNYPMVQQVKTNANVFWSEAVTLGVKYVLNKTTTDYILLWNNDSIPAEDYFENLFALLENNPINTIIGSKIYLMSTTNIIWSMGGIFDPYTGKKFMIGFNCSDNDQFNEEKEVDWLPGMGTIIHKSIFNKIGFWDFIHFPQYHGDSDFTLRAKQNGSNIYVSPKLKMWNDKSTTGLYHQQKITFFIKSFIDIRSTKNIIKDFRFYYRHSKSFFAYQSLIKKYLFYTLRFIRETTHFNL